MAWSSGRWCSRSTRSRAIRCSTRIAFIECAGNGAVLYPKRAGAADRAADPGLLSCAEWTGVKLSDAAGGGRRRSERRSGWWRKAPMPSGMSRSIPLAKAMDDALIALYQNGERVRPSNGYPMRLLLPGYEGNMNVKWLRRIKLTEGPAMTKDETSKYTITARQTGNRCSSCSRRRCKSVITRPSPGMTLSGPACTRSRVWPGRATARSPRSRSRPTAARAGRRPRLQEPVLPKALTRFRMPWRWNGGPVTLQSRATDETGMVQPTRASDDRRARQPRRSIIATRSRAGASTTRGEVKHVYA